MLKGILLDYGGTIDTNGIHWGEVLWDIYCKYDIQVDKDSFKKAYIHAEKMLATNPLILPSHNFLDVLNIKIACQFSFLNNNGRLPLAANNEAKIKNMSGDGNSFALYSINKAIPVLEELYKKYPLVIVSNFYGNMHTVLKTFGIEHFFKKIIESSVVGIRKPDPAIFALGAGMLALNPGKCVAVGDSYTKDIIPATAAGCKTIWLKGKGWGDDPNDVSFAGTVINNFSELPAAIAAVSDQKLL